jgi:membrane protein YdbS with pleckstrin-like domain
MYYLWLNNAQAGPYTLLQVQSLWKEGQITALTLFWQEGNADWQPLSTIQSTIEPVRDVSQDKTAVMPSVQKMLDQRKREQETAAAANPAPPASHMEEVQWTGSPTLWKWAIPLCVGFFLCLLPIGGFLFFPAYALFGLITLPLVLVIFVYIYFARTSTRYTITNKRVSMEHGIFSKTSRELRIQDIRSIAAHINFIGYGDLEFSSASDEVDVTFTAVSGAAAVRDLVKKLQA